MGQDVHNPEGRPLIPVRRHMPAKAASAPAQPSDAPAQPSEAEELVVSAELSPMGGTPMLRVGDLRRLMADVADDVPVVLAAGGWYRHVGAVGVPLPDMSGDYGCLTFVPGEDFDARDY